MPRGRLRLSECRIILFVLILILQLSCKTEQPQTSVTSKYKDPYPMPADAETVNITGKHGGTLVAATLSDPKTFNQLLFADETSQFLNQVMNPGLTRLNLVTQEPEPGLAKSWEVSEDKLTWIFHLRKGLQWSDGKPFTADDVLFTMQIVNDPKIPSGAQDAMIRGIRWSKMDDYTVVADLPSIFVSFLRSLDGATIPIIAKHKWEESYKQGKFQQVMQVNMNLKDYTTLGAFKLSEYKPGEYVKLVRNPLYWKKDLDGKRLPYLDELIILTIPDQNQIFLKLQNGELDTHHTVRPEDVEPLSRKAAQLKMKVIRVGPSYDTEGLWFNLNTSRNPKTGKPYVSPVKISWFTDLNFRKAIAYSIDREALVQNVLFGKGVPAYGPESVSNQKWYNPNLIKYTYDPQKAMEYLRASGFVQNRDASGKFKLYDKKGNEVRFSLHTNSGNTLRTRACELIASDLAKLGIQVDFTPLDFSLLVTKIQNTFDYDAILLGLSHDDIDPAGGLNIWRSSGSLHFWWPRQKTPATPWEKRIDELMLALNGTYNSNERKKYYDELQRIVSEQVPIIYTFTQLVHVAIRENLGNVKPTIARHRTLWNAEELYWK